MMLPDRRVCAAAVKDWAWNLNNPTAEVEEGLRRLLDLHCAHWVYGRELGQQGNPHPTSQRFCGLKVKVCLATVKFKLSLGLRTSHIYKSTKACLS